VLLLLFLISAPASPPERNYHLSALQPTPTKNARGARQISHLYQERVQKEGLFAFQMEAFAENPRRP
jgi:hypothetical protein